MFKLERDDKLKARWLLAVIAAVNGFFVFPPFVAYCAIRWHLSDSICGDMLTYMGL
jgi:hypothetical protein